MLARLILALGLVVGAAAPQAAELIMFERADCPWCRAWHREVGPIYPKTPEAARLPIRSVDMTKPRPAEFAGISGIRFTPTFVVIDAGREIDRLVGYSGEDQFWGWVDGVVARLDPAQGGAARPSASSRCGLNQEEATC